MAFNRMPILGIAACRRMVSSAAAAYFDDELSLEFIQDTDVSQSGLHLVFGLMGSPPQAQKRFWAAADRCYLGASVHVGLAHSHGIVRVQPKASSIYKVRDKIDRALAMRQLARDDAGKLRGDIQWLFACCTGSAAKFAGPLLHRCQYGDDPSLGERDLLVLPALRALACQAPPRDINFWASHSPCTLIYSDASFEQNQLRLGWVIFAPPPLRPHGGNCSVPQAVLQEWTPRKQQIFPGEALCLLVLPLLYPDLFRGQDTLWFIDNQVAVAAAVKASSSEEDVFEIAHMSSVLRGRLANRRWFEWVDSDSNPSDGLFREGEDCWSRSQPWFLQSFSFPKAAYRSQIRSDLLTA